MGDEQAELQRRWASVSRASDVADGPTDARRHGATCTAPTGRSPRQARSAIERGDFLIVLGDFHGGDNPLAQGVFGLRHADPAALIRRFAPEAGPGVHLSPPRRGVVE